MVKRNEDHITDGTPQEKSKVMKQAVAEALRMYNQDHGKSYDWGSNWNGTGDLETYLYNNLFPKVAETNLVTSDIKNAFNPYFKEVDDIAQLREDYVFLDTVPVNLNVTSDALKMLEANYKKIATRLYDKGEYKQRKYSLNSKEARQKMSTFGDVTKHVLGMRQAEINGINQQEEQESRAIVVDYALNMINERREVSSLEEAASAITLAIMNLRANMWDYNETRKASGGAIGRYTSSTDIQNIMILTTDEVKKYVLETTIANTFQIAGLDPTKRIMSFPKLGNVWKITEDILIADASTVEYFRTFGDWKTEVGKRIVSGSVFTFDVSGLTEFVGKVIEVAPKTPYFAVVTDIRNLRFGRNTQGMERPPFYNPEDAHYTWWIDYLSTKQMGLFRNKILIGGKADIEATA